MPAIYLFMNYLNVIKSKTWAFLFVIQKCPKKKNNLKCIQNKREFNFKNVK